MPAPLSDAAQDAKRTRILDAARRVCQRSDLDSAKMADIAAEARVSKGTLYRFFQSKEDLLLEMVRTDLAELAAAINSAVEASPPAEKLPRFVDLVIESVPASLERNRIVFQALGFAARDVGASARLDQIYREHYATRTGLLAQAFRQAQERGIYRRDLDAESAVSCLIATMDGLVWRCSFDADAREPIGLRSCCEQLVSAWTPSSSSVPGSSAA